MVDSFSLDVEVGDYIKSTTSFISNKLVSETAPAVVYSSDNEFMAKDAKLYLADTEAGLAGATEVKVESVNISIAKNLIDYQTL
ncbi:MAG: hypothetical protein AB8F78_05120 [Saprospiraceae bacterium]